MLMKTSLIALLAASFACAAPLSAVRRDTGPTGAGLEEAVNDGVLDKVSGAAGSGTIVQGELGDTLHTALTQIIDAVANLKKRDQNGNGIVVGEAGSGLRETLNEGVVPYVAGESGILKGSLGDGLDTLLENVVNNVAGGTGRKVRRDTGPTGAGLEEAVNDGVLDKVAGAAGSGTIVQGELGDTLHTALTQIIDAVANLKKRDQNGNGIVVGEAGSGLRKTLNEGVVPYVAGESGILKGSLGDGLDTLLENVVNNVAGGTGRKVRRDTGPTGAGLEEAVNDGVLDKVAGAAGSGTIVQGELGDTLHTALTQIVDAVANLKKRDQNGDGIVVGEAGSGLRETLNEGVVPYVAGESGILKGSLGDGLDTLLENVVNNVAGGTGRKVRRDTGPTGAGLEEAVNDGVLDKVAGAAGSGTIVQGELGHTLHAALTQIIDAVANLKKRDQNGNGIVVGEAGSGLRETLNEGVVPYVAGESGILKGSLGDGLDTLLENVVNNVAGGTGRKVRRDTGPTGAGLEEAVNDGVLDKVAGAAGSGTIVQGELGDTLHTALTQIVDAVANLKKRDQNGDGIVVGEAGSGLRETLNDGVVKYVAGDEGILKGSLGNGLNELLDNVVNNVAGGTA